MPVVTGRRRIHVTVTWQGDISIDLARSRRKHKRSDIHHSTPTEPKRRMTGNSLNISAIPAYNDNYIWLLRGEGRACAVVDPGDHRPVLETLQREGLDLVHILITHHHADHTGGVGALLQHYPARTTGPEDTRIAGLDQVVFEGDTVDLLPLGARFDVIEVPGHTRSHIAFVGGGALFCGDTLFSVGCGRLFEGTPAQMQASLDKLSALPDETRVYCAHEYTQSNCAFALQVEPSNPALLDRAKRVDKARSNNEITLPSTIGEEKSVNPFLRTREPEVVSAARKIDANAQAGDSTMAVIRSWKDRF
jgi:hydroxyacylglutathione hydrolase